MDRSLAHLLLLVLIGRSLPLFNYCLLLFRFVYNCFYICMAMVHLVLNRNIFGKFNQVRMHEKLSGF